MGSRNMLIESDIRPSLHQNFEVLEVVEELLGYLEEIDFSRRV